jgi:hypothetical protein
MNDISKCANRTCPLSGTCYRKSLPDSGIQLYSDFEWSFIHIQPVCEFYIKNNPSPDYNKFYVELLSNKFIEINALSYEAAVKYAVVLHLDTRSVYKVYHEHEIEKSKLENSIIKTVTL